MNDLPDLLDDDPLLAAASDNQLPGKLSTVTQKTVADVDFMKDQFNKAFDDQFPDEFVDHGLKIKGFRGKSITGAKSKNDFLKITRKMRTRGSRELDADVSFDKTLSG